MCKVYYEQHDDRGRGGRGGHSGRGGRGGRAGRCGLCGLGGYCSRTKYLLQQNLLQNLLDRNNFACRVLKQNSLVASISERCWASSALALKWETARC